MPEYPWYGFAAEGAPLEQGEIIEGVPFIRPVEIPEEGDPTVEVITSDVIVISQSCDLLKRSVAWAQVCPVHSLDVAGELNPYLASTDGKERLRRGEVVGFHLLDACQLEGHKRPHRIVEFRQVLQASKERLLDYVSGRPRLRLLPPYREHLAQAFARFFMRVGLPQDIDRFE